MSEQIWADVDAYLAEALLPADPVMTGLLAANAQAGLPAIDVSATQGRFLELLVRITGARRILEIGTLGGYSTVWMARALPTEGRLVTLEYARAHAEVARANFARAGLSERIELRVGAALDSLRGSSAMGWDRSTWSSSTPTSPATRPIWTGRSGLRAEAR